MVKNPNSVFSCPEVGLTIAMIASTMPKHPIIETGVIVFAGTCRTDRYQKCNKKHHGQRPRSRCPGGAPLAEQDQFAEEREAHQPKAQEEDRNERIIG